VRLKLYRVDSPGTLTVNIRATDESGHPTGEDLCSGTTDGDTLTTNVSGEWREITLGAGYLLVADTKYAIVIRVLGGDENNQILWLLDYSSPTYVGGCLESSVDSGDNWESQLDSVCMFEEWGEYDWVTTDWQNTLETDDTYYEDLTGLTANTEYEFQAQARNSAGEGEWSSSEYFTTLGGQPIMRRWGGSILPVGAQRIGKGW
jgi:hypothetical protein